MNINHCPASIKNDAISYFGKIYDIKHIKYDLMRDINVKDFLSSLFDAKYWFYIITNYTIDSKLIEITDEEANALIYSEKISDRLKNIISECLINEYFFVKSSKKSSHSRKKCLTLCDVIDELTYPDVKITFKIGCRHIFMRKWIDNISSEYRIYIYANKIRYIEKYIQSKTKLYSKEEEIKYAKEVITFCNEFKNNLEYDDFIVDIAKINNVSKYIVIEINTPMYLYGGLQLGNYDWDHEKIHTTNEIIFRYEVFTEIGKIINEVIIK